MLRWSYIGFLVIACPLLMPKARAAESQSVQHFERTVTKTLSYKFLLSLPPEYKSTSRKRWPLIFFLHGSGERGDDVWSVARQGPPKLIRGAELSRAERAAAKFLTENFVVVSPQCPKHKAWDTETLVALLDEVIAKHRIDGRRVYLTGLSMGGYGAWTLGMAYPERFAAMAPICGGGEFFTAYMSSLLKRADLRRLPVWAFHGAKDPAVPVIESERMIAMLKHMEVREPKLTVYPNAEHDSWTETYANLELYRWFLSHERPE